MSETTWVAWGSGRVPVGVNTGDSNFNTVEKTGGESEHTLTVNEMPEHNHGNVFVASGNGDTTLTTDAFATQYHQTRGFQWLSTRGGSQPHNNLQPYITCYMWKRTA